MESFLPFWETIQSGWHLLAAFVLVFRNERVRAGATVGTQELVRLVIKKKPSF